MKHKKEHELLNIYKKLFKQVPSWGYPIAPPIPFVGDSYPSDGQGALIYASAENLGYTWPLMDPTIEGWRAKLLVKSNEWPWFKEASSQMMRGRMMLNLHGGTSVHIEPINNGGLLKVARHILQSVITDRRYVDEPSDFLQQIAVANPGKFSIRPNDGEKAVNNDYAGPRHWRKFKEQIDYIAADLSILRPRVLIVPMTILESLRRCGLWSSVEAHLPNLVIGMRQVQQRAIVRKHGARVPAHLDSALPAGYGAWPAPACADTYIRWMIENAVLFKPKNGLISL